jgi:leucyl aminopeptidase (aminopeptidase T)
MDGALAVRMIELLRQVMHKLLNERPAITRWEELRAVMQKINPHLEDDEIIRIVGPLTFDMVMQERQKQAQCITP